MYLFNPIPLEKYSLFAHYAKAFTKEECEEIIALYNKHNELPSTTGVNQDSLFTEESSIRNSVNCWIAYSEDTRWIFERLHQFVHDVNSVRYKFELKGFTEPLQLARYEPGSFYKWHQDFGPGQFSTRKLSLVVQLTDPAEYEGGGLQFFEGNQVAPTDQGTVILFPSFNTHQVLPLISGTRHSLVAWVNGEPYR